MGSVPRVVLKGAVDFVPLTEVVRFLGRNSCTGILRIKRKDGKETGLIGFSGGDVLNATNSGVSGMDAIMELFAWTEGEYEFFEKDVSSRRIITESLDEIVRRGVALDGGKPRPPVAEKAQSPDGFRGPRLITGPPANYSYVVEEYEYAPGQNIVEQGSRGSWISVVLEGEADILRQTPRGPVTLCRIGPGALIGDLAIVLNRQNVRGATVKAVDDVVLGLLDLKSIYTEFSRMSAEMRGLFVSLNRRWSQLNACLVDMHLGANRLQKQVADRTKEFPVDKGEAWIIRKGTAVVLKKTANGNIPVGVFGEGDFLGDVPFMQVGHEPGHGLVRTTRSMESDSLDIAALTAEYDEAPPMVRSIIEYVTNCVYVTTAILEDVYGRNVSRRSRGA
ncbi:MAG: cyclic nucleotide-binding domain-containing protein [Desulfatibacillaceae bacterium]